MLEFKPKEAPKTKKVMMLWDEELHKRAKDFANEHGISISELSRLAINKVLDSK